MEKTIRVTGKGKVQVRPDRIKLNIRVEEENRKYDAVLEHSSKAIERLRTVVEELGFTSKDLKTIHFYVDTVYENYQTLDKSWKKRFQKYKAVHSLKLEMDMDHQVLGKVLYGMANCGVNPEFTIEYTVKDGEEVKNELIYKAVQDSMGKAKVLTAAAGTCLGDLLTIDYSWGEINLVSCSEREIMAKEIRCYGETGAAYDFDMEPEDIDVTDTVTCVWKIG